MAGFPRVFGRYTLDAAIGMGGMAEVFLAHTAYQGFHKVCCIKRVLPHLDTAEFTTLFHNEAAIVAQLRHTNIVQVFDFGECEGVLYLAMEYIKGADLWAMMRRAATLDTSFGIGPTLQIIKGLCRGLHHAHTQGDAKTSVPLNIVVADVSPQNVLISSAGEVKLTDFGVAKAVLRSRDGEIDPDTNVNDKVMRGKVPYAAPEQILGRPLDHRTDQFATGIILWELLTGRRLFPGHDVDTVARKILSNNIAKPSRYNRDVPKELGEIVLKSLALRPQDRYADMHAFEQAISRFLLQNFNDPSSLSVSGLMQRLRSNTPAQANLGTDARALAQPTSFWSRVRGWMKVGQPDERVMAPSHALDVTAAPKTDTSDNPMIPALPEFAETAIELEELSETSDLAPTAESDPAGAESLSSDYSKKASPKPSYAPPRRPLLIGGVGAPLSFAEALEYLAPLVLSVHRDQPELPPVPRCAQQVIDVVSREEVDIADIAHAVQQDTAIVKEILRVANSTVYRGASEVTSVRDAVVRMGMVEAKGLAAGTAARALFAPQDESVLLVMPERWRNLHGHCLLSGFACGYLARALRQGDPGEAFLAGMFHDIGKVSALQALCLLSNSGLVPFALTPALIDQILEALHVDLGSEAMMHWGLPSFLFDICAEHHDDALGASASPLLHMVRVVSSLNSLRTSEFNPVGLRAQLKNSIAALGMGRDAVSSLLKNMDGLREKVDVVMGAVPSQAQRNAA